MSFHEEEERIECGIDLHFAVVGAIARESSGKQAS